MPFPQWRGTLVVLSRPLVSLLPPSVALVGFLVSWAFWRASRPSWRPSRRCNLKELSPGVHLEQCSTPIPRYLSPRTESKVSKPLTAMRCPNHSNKIRIGPCGPITRGSSTCTDMFTPSSSLLQMDGAAMPHLDPIIFK